MDVQLLYGYVIPLSVIGASVSAIVTTFSYTYPKDGDGWDHSWAIMSNTIKGSVWYVSVPLIHFYRTYKRWLSPPQKRTVHVDDR